MNLEILATRPPLPECLRGEAGVRGQFPFQNLVSKQKERNPMKASKNNYRFTAAVLGVTVLLWIASAVTHATVLYFNGFEPGDPGTRDFYDSTTDTQGADITIVPSGGGALGLTAASGGYYAEITNVPDTYRAGYGESVSTDYGYQYNGGTFSPGPYSPVPNGPGVASNAFYESTDYYINTSWAAASADNNYEGFWIDTTPFSDPYYQDETNFRIIDSGNGQIGVQMVGLNGSGSATITQSGWYTFKTTFENDGSGNVLNNMSVSDSLGNVIGSFAADSSLPYADLGGTNYGDWTTVWQDGFANNVLGIDNVEVGTVPEPASLSLLGLGVPLLLRRRRRA
jgi:hypothetical protein